MTRKEFLGLLGINASLICLGACQHLPENVLQLQTVPAKDTLATNNLASTATTQTHRRDTGNGPPPPPPPKLDFTIDTALPQYAGLQIPGGFVYHTGIIIAQTLQGQYIAASEQCTHNGLTIGFDGNNNQFRCPAHGSTFATDGTVVIGPARSNIKTYNTRLNGNLLRVYEA